MMNFPFSRTLFSTGCMALALGAAHATEPAIIAKARSFLGSESALNGLKSVHYTGSLVTTLSDDPSKTLRQTVEIIVQKPDQQRVTVTSDTTIEVNGLNGYEGWQHVNEIKDPKKWRRDIFKPDVLKRVRAQARENLNFFGGLEKIGGRYEEQGTKNIDGVTCQKIAFIHGPGIVFIRYFDVVTGRLVLTETEDGSSTREQGEMNVNGIRFPKGMVITSKLPNGQTRTSTITFDKITVNETFPSSTFAMPPTER
jgi:outer membrane lipoprotein-sorting protein